MPSTETEWEETLEWPSSAAWQPDKLCQGCGVWTGTTERPLFEGRATRQVYGVKNLSVAF